MKKPVHIERAFFLEIGVIGFQRVVMQTTRGGLGDWETGRRQRSVGESINIYLE